MTDRNSLQTRLKGFILLSAFILVMEVVGGIFANSLALLSDAGHLLTDLSALLLAYFAVKLSKRSPTERFTFGYYRAEILAAIVNGVSIILIAIYIFYESYVRFISPESVKGPEMFAIATIGLLANLYVVTRMQGYEKENLNIRGAYLHVISDTLSSVGVVIVAGLIFLTGNFIFDPIVSALIGLLMLVGSFRLVRDSARILMEAAPHNIRLEKLVEDLRKMRHVKGVHDVHVWSLSSDVYALSSHILIDARDTKSINRIVTRINNMLRSKYNITHTAIQSECERCVEDNADSKCTPECVLTQRATRRPTQKSATKHQRTLS